MSKDFIKKSWIIFGKGEEPKMIHYANNIEYADFSYGYLTYMFNGTRGELDDIILDLLKDETYFKLIDYFEYKSEEYWLFKYGPDYKKNKEYQNEVN